MRYFRGFRLNSREISSVVLGPKRSITPTRWAILLRGNEHMPPNKLPPLVKLALRLTWCARPARLSASGLAQMFGTTSGYVPLLVRGLVRAGGVEPQLEVLRALYGRDVRGIVTFAEFCLALSSARDLANRQLM